MLSVSLIFTILLTSVAVGLLSGLFGLGGGTIVVPLLFYVLPTLGMNPDYVMHVAVGTSFLTMVATTLSSTIAHSRNKKVSIEILKTFAPSILVGIAAGLVSAKFIKSSSMQLIFGVVIALVAINMMFGKKRALVKIQIPVYVEAIIGFGIGYISSLIGIGGASLAIPVFLYLGYDISKAIGTSAAIGMLISLPSSIGYIICGLGKDVMLPYTLGFVNLLIFVILAPVAVLMAPVGVKINKKMNKDVLKKIFAVFLIYTSIKMLMTL